jgi:hypothetical protein
MYTKKIQDLLGKKVGKTISLDDAAWLRVQLAAANGNLEAAKFIAERCEGKPKQDIAITDAKRIIIDVDGEDDIPAETAPGTWDGDADGGGDDSPADTAEGV